MGEVIERLKIQKTFMVARGTMMMRKQGQGMSKDMLRVHLVREQMDKQIEEDMVRLAMANRVVRESHQGHNRVLNLARESRRQNLMLNAITDQALEVGSRLKTMLTRDPRELPQEAIDAAKKARSPYNFL